MIKIEKLSMKERREIMEKISGNIPERVTNYNKLQNYTIETMSQKDFKSDYSNKVVGGDVEATIKVKGGDVNRSQNDYKSDYSTKVVGGEVGATLKVKGGDGRGATKSQNDSKIYYPNKVVGGEVEATLKVKGGDDIGVVQSQNDSKLYYSDKVVGGEVEATIKVKGGEDIKSNDYCSVRFSNYVAPTVSHPDDNIRSTVSRPELPDLPESLELPETVAKIVVANKVVDSEVDIFETRSQVDVDTMNLNLITSTGKVTASNVFQTTKSLVSLQDPKLSENVTKAELKNRNIWSLFSPKFRHFPSQPNSTNPKVTSEVASKGIESTPIASNQPEKVSKSQIEKYSELEGGQSTVSNLVACRKQDQNTQETN